MTHAQDPPDRPAARKASALVVRGVRLAAPDWPTRDVQSADQTAVKIIVPVTDPTNAGLLGSARAARDACADLVEWRVDHFDLGDDLSAVRAALKDLRTVLADIPLLATVRTRAEGGSWQGTPQGYRAVVSTLIASGADLVDIEHSMDRAVGDALIAEAHDGAVAVVASSHDFEATPPRTELVSRLCDMQSRGADIAKLAVMPRSPADVLALFDATWTMASQHPDTPVITMAMGSLGRISRLAGGVFGSCATFASVTEASAPGQMPVDNLRAALALLGD